VRPSLNMVADRNVAQGLRLYWLSTRSTRSSGKPPFYGKTADLRLVAQEPFDELERFFGPLQTCGIAIVSPPRRTMPPSLPAATAVGRRSGAVARLLRRPDADRLTGGAFNAAIENA